MSNDRIIQPHSLRMRTIKLEVDEQTLERWATKRDILEQVMSSQQRAICVLVARLGGTVELTSAELEEADEVIHRSNDIGLFTYRNGLGDVKIQIGPRVDAEESLNGEGSGAVQGSDVPPAEGELPQPPEALGGAEGASPQDAGQLEADLGSRPAEASPAG